MLAATKSLMNALWQLQGMPNEIGSKLCYCISLFAEAIAMLHFSTCAAAACSMCQVKITHSTWK